jgi:hypothetical protein
VTAWEEYIESAPAGDQWLPIAKARLKTCEKERDIALQKARAGKRRPVQTPEPSPDEVD